MAITYSVKTVNDTPADETGNVPETSIPNLQEVTDSNSSTTNSISVNNLNLPAAGVIRFNMADDGSAIINGYVGVVALNAGTGNLVLQVSTESTLAGDFPSFASPFIVAKPFGANISEPADFADNAAAISGGLVIGDIYKTGDALKVVHS